MQQIDLRLGDCLELMKDVPDGSVDMILCDLPYGTTACKWDAVIPFELLWDQYKRIIKINGVIVLTASQPFTSQLVTSNTKWFKYQMYWIKPQGTDPLRARFRPMNNVDEILVFYDKKPTFNPQYTEGKPYTITRDKKARTNETTFLGTFKETTTINNGRRYPVRTLYFSQEKGLHPTQKPVALLEYLIRTYANQGETVLDNCMGSGSTGVACINTNRNFVGMELDKQYFAIAEKRIADAADNREVVNK